MNGYCTNAYLGQPATEVANDPDELEIQGYLDSLEDEQDDEYIYNGFFPEGTFDD